MYTLYTYIATYQYCQLNGLGELFTSPECSPVIIVTAWPHRRVNF